MAASQSDTVAVFTKNRLNPAYHGARLGAERTAARFGLRVEHYVPELADNLDQQVALVERALVSRPAAFVFVPVHATALDPWVRRIGEAGIPLFNLINRLTHPQDYVTFVGSDDRALSGRVARRLLDELGGRGNVVVLEGPSTTVTSRDRVGGFVEAIGGFPGVRLAGSRAGAFLRAEGRQAMRELLADVTVIDGVMAANDDMALGAIEALEAAGRRCPVIGVNAVPEAVAAIGRGSMLASASFDAFSIACIATEAAARHLRGEPVPKEILLPVHVVDRTNCERWNVPLEGRAAPQWEECVGRQPPGAQR
jgi:ribose transport system substrate-binding protein